MHIPVMIVKHFKGSVGSQAKVGRIQRHDVHISLHFGIKIALTNVQPRSTQSVIGLHDRVLSENDRMILSAEVQITCSLPPMMSAT